MNVVIAGAGIVGFALAEQLSDEGHQVSVIDTKRSKLRELTEKLDVLAVHGHASTPSVLRRAGIEQADMAIAVTASDEVNLIIGLIASRMQVKHPIVRVRNQELMDGSVGVVAGDLGVGHVINPEPRIVGALVRMIDIPGATEAEVVAGGRIIILGFTLDEDSPASGVTPAELRASAQTDEFLILYIERGEEMFVPSGHDELLPGDTVHVLAPTEQSALVSRVFVGHVPATERVVIAGATRVGLALAAALQDRVDSVVLVEQDPDLAEDAAAELSRARVMSGAVTELDVLEEAIANQTDLFCAVTQHDHNNLLAGLLAKRHGADRTAAVVRQPEYVEVLKSLGVETVMSPRLVTIGEILLHVRRGTVFSVTRMAQGNAEILDLEAGEGCPGTRGAISQLKFPKNALIGALMRDGNMMLPTGETKIEPGDRVIVFAFREAVPKIERLFCG